MYLDEASVTGTETALLAAACADGHTEIRHAATEPHVVELCEFLAKMGAGVERASAARRCASKACRVCTAPSTARRRLHRGRELGRRRGDHRRRDRRSTARAKTTSRWSRAVLKRMNVQCGMRDGVFEVKPSRPTAVRRITTGLWPAFPSDLVSLVTVLATQAEGRTLVHDWMYELRLFALEQMSGMGADMFLADAHRIIVTGPTKLRGGRMLDTRDLRSGMSLIAGGARCGGVRRALPRSRRSNAGTRYLVRAPSRRSGATIRREWNRRRT